MITTNAQNFKVDNVSEETWKFMNNTLFNKMDLQAQVEPLMDVEEALLEMAMFEQLEMLRAKEVGRNGNKN